MPADCSQFRPFAVQIVPGKNPSYPSETTILADFDKVLYRTRVIRHFGAQCTVCGFDFARVYSGIAIGFIHHHLVPLSTIGREYEVNPIRDLRPVCPNCHAVIHRRSPPYSIEELKGFISSQS